uniref:Thioredoxin domain-containing protein n=1 Tax=Hippocampus comes TaxID=109280 RepID=A0A3Q2XEN0_HIPCM
RTLVRSVSGSAARMEAHASLDLTPSSFRSLLLEGHDPWVVDFYAPWCGPCKHFAPEFEVVARVLKGEVRAGKIDCQAHYQTCESAGITAYPTVRFYEPDRDGNRVRTRPPARTRTNAGTRMNHGTCVDSARTAARASTAEMQT